MSEDTFRKDARRLTEVFIEGIVEAARNAFSSHHKGTKWQHEFRELAESKGLTVLEVKQHEGRHDYWVNNWKVQCKCIDEVRGGWIAIDNMRPVKSNDNERGYKSHEADVFAIRTGNTTLLIPTEQLQDTSKPGFIKSKIRRAEYEWAQDNWGVFTGNSAHPSMLF